MSILFNETDFPEEYRAANPDGLAIVVLHDLRGLEEACTPTMRQTHMGGEKVFVDFAGDTIDIIDPITGEAHAMKLFVAAMGASNYTYAEACPSESLPDWIGMHPTPQKRRLPRPATRTASRSYAATSTRWRP